jgi:hypothetical protein
MALGSVNLPPDADLVKLAVAANAKLKPNAGVSFYRIHNPDQSIETGIVFECGARRAVVRTRNILTAHDADEIVQSVTAWMNRIRPTDKWSTNPEDAS